MYSYHTLRHFLIFSSILLGLTACGGGGGGGTATVPPTAGISVSTQSLQTDESGTESSFTIRLNSAPASNVEITYLSLDSTEGLIGSTSDTDSGLQYFDTTVRLLFTTTNWDTPQTVVVQGQDDTVHDGDQTFAITLDSLVTSDSNYLNVVKPHITSTNIDNDLPGITVSTTSLRTAEKGEPVSYTVRLNYPPAADVTVPLHISDSTEATFRRGFNVPDKVLTFTTANWSVNQAVFIWPVDDSVHDGDQVYDITTGPASSTDANYSGLTGVSVSVTNADTETADLVLFQSSGPAAHLYTNESGTNSSFTVALNSEPAASVFVTVTSANSNEGLLTGGNSLVTPVDVITLEFTPANWPDGQAVTVHGQDDAVTDGAVTYNLSVATTPGIDSNYNSVASKTISVTNIDDDLFNAEGTFSTPVDITASRPYTGMVDTNASYYMITGLRDIAYYGISVTAMSDNVDLAVYNTPDFSVGLLCTSANTGVTDEECRITPNNGTVYIKVSGSSTANGAAYLINLQSIYSFEIYNGVEPFAPIALTYIELYHSSNLRIPIATAITPLSDPNNYSMITMYLTSGETYYLKVSDANIVYGLSPRPAPYSVRVHDYNVRMPVLVNGPIVDAEPYNNDYTGATVMALFKYYDTWLGYYYTGYYPDDIDWYAFTVP